MRVEWCVCVCVCVWRHAKRMTGRTLWSFPCRLVELEACEYVCVSVDMLLLWSDTNTAGTGTETWQPHLFFLLICLLFFSWTQLPFPVCFLNTFFFLSRTGGSPHPSTVVFRASPFDSGTRGRRRHSAVTMNGHRGLRGLRNAQSIGIVAASSSFVCKSLLKTHSVWIFFSFSNDYYY